MGKTLRNFIIGFCLSLLFLAGSASAEESPTVTIQNESSEAVLAKLAGPMTGVVTVPAGEARTVKVQGGQYLALFRYGVRHYSYTKVGPFDVVQTATEFSEITIVLHTSAGNTNEDSSDEREFDSR